MKSLTLTSLPTLPFLAAAAATASSSSSTSTNNDIPTSTDASAFLTSALTNHNGGVPPWATGQYATTLASALYSVETSFVGASHFPSVVNAILSAAQQYGGTDDDEDDHLAPLGQSGWDWGAHMTTHSWYTAHVPADVQARVSQYDAAWASVYTSVEAIAVAVTATSSNQGDAAAAAAGLPWCTGMVQAAGVAAGVAVAVAGVM